jgi:hypothetical protein
VPDDRVHRWRTRLRTVGTLEDRAPGGVAVHALRPAEVDAILAVTEQWGEVDRSHRKLAHRGSYIGAVWVSPSTFRRVLAAHGLVLAEPPARDPTPKRGWPDWLEWAPNRIWCWDATHFPRAKRVAFAIIDVVSRRWIETLVSVELGRTGARCQPLELTRFPGPPAEPDVRVSTHPALHVFMPPDQPMALASGSACHGVGMRSPR